MEIKINNILNININSLLEKGISLDGYLILYCLNNKNIILLSDYVQKCGLIKREAFINLKDKGFISMGDIETITFNSLSITEKGLSLFNTDTIKNDNIKFDECFNELRNTYPKKVPNENGGTRALHGDLSRCKKLYEKIIIKDNQVDMKLHKKILNALKIQLNECNKGKGIFFLQALVTYLHQQTYEQYIEQIKDEDKDIQVITEVKTENKTVLGREEF